MFLFHYKILILLFYMSIQLVKYLLSIKIMFCCRFIYWNVERVKKRKNKEKGIKRKIIKKKLNKRKKICIFQSFWGYQMNASESHLTG